jgi:hypothetical protein
VYVNFLNALCGVTLPPFFSGGLGWNDEQNLKIQMPSMKNAKWLLRPDLKMIQRR